MDEMTERERDELVENIVEQANNDAGILYSIVRHYISTWSREDYRMWQGEEE